MYFRLWNWLLGMYAVVWFVLWYNDVLSPRVRLLLVHIIMITSRSTVHDRWHPLIDAMYLTNFAMIDLSIPYFVVAGVPRDSMTYNSICRWQQALVSMAYSSPCTTRVKRATNNNRPHHIVILYSIFRHFQPNPISWHRTVYHTLILLFFIHARFIWGPMERELWI